MLLVYIGIFLTTFHTATDVKDEYSREKIEAFSLLMKFVCSMYNFSSSE